MNPVKHEVKSLGVVSLGRLGGLLLLMFAVPWPMAAQLEVLPMERVSAVFGGGKGDFNLLVRNQTDELVKGTVYARVFQLSSASAMPVGGNVIWKRLTVLGGQTVLEKAGLSFPSVRAVTRFNVRWSDESEATIGQSLVAVYPTNLLEELSNITAKIFFGIFDPQKRISSLLTASKVEFVNLLEGERLDSVREGLVIAGPFDSAEEITSELRNRFFKLASLGVAVVIIAPPVDDTTLPQHVLLVNGRLANISPEMLANLEADPRAQEALVQCARLTLNPAASSKELKP
jgi:hypothetical protein